jgi:hypothetical protein
MSPKRFRHILQPDWFVLDKSELYCVITIAARRTFGLDDDAWTRLDDGYRRDRSVFSEELRHPKFSTNDSTDHIFCSEYHLEAANP